MTFVVQRSTDISAACLRARSRGLDVWLVPTMGALHEGHAALIKHAKSGINRFVVVSIFVNPLQFGPNEDFAQYPRPLDRDIELCKTLGVDMVFAPTREVMFPKEFETHVEVSGYLTRTLEGEHRPTHFRGVTTVVAKLFNLSGECYAVFGQKDYQQLRVISRMVTDLSMPVTLVSHPIVRDADGLALSSRNHYLRVDDRKKALGLVSALRATQQVFEQGERNAEALESIARNTLVTYVDKIDYVSVRDTHNLAVIERVDNAAVLMIAAHVSRVRLIDNILLKTNGV